MPNYFSGLRRIQLPMIARLIVVALLALAASIVAPPTAQAHSSLSTTKEWRSTSNCPCSLSDEWDGTYFAYDSGGEAIKMRVYEGDRLVGKFEFHPYGDRYYVYDTAANNDAIYWNIWVPGEVNLDTTDITPGRAGTSRSLDFDGDLPEGARVVVTAYDSRTIADNGNWELHNRIGQIEGVS